MPIKASPHAALPVITFAGELRFHLNGEEIHAFHVPGAHTDGDAIVHFRTSNVVHLGDVFFNKLYPFIDTSSGGSVDGLDHAVRRQEANVCLAGLHGRHERGVVGSDLAANRNTKLFAEEVSDWLDVVDQLARLT